MAFTFTGPKGQTITFTAGRLRTRGLNYLEADDLRSGSLEVHAVLPTGPMRGGKGLTDAVSVYLAAWRLFPHWEVTGTVPDMKVPGSTSRDIVA